MGGGGSKGGAPSKPKPKKEKRREALLTNFIQINYSMRYLANSNRKSSLIIFVS